MVLTHGGLDSYQQYTKPLAPKKTRTNMSTWPVTYPDNVQDKGRLTQLFVVPVNDFAKFKETTLKEHFKSARQVLEGKTIDDGNSGDALDESVLDTSGQKSGQSMVVLVDADPNEKSSNLKGIHSIHQTLVQRPPFTNSPNTIKASNPMAQPPIHSSPPQATPLPPRPAITSAT
jgi:hypothetical protein